MINNIQDTSKQCPEHNNGTQNTTDREYETDSKHNFSMKANKTSKKGCETQIKPVMAKKEHKSSTAKGCIKISDLKSKVSHLIPQFITSYLDKYT